MRENYRSYFYNKHCRELMEMEKSTQSKKGIVFVACVALSLGVLMLFQKELRIVYWLLAFFYFYLSLVTFLFLFQEKSKWVKRVWPCLIKPLIFIVPFFEKKKVGTIMTITSVMLIFLTIIGLFLFPLVKAFCGDNQDLNYLLLTLYCVLTGLMFLATSKWFETFFNNKLRVDPMQPYSAELIRRVIYWSYGIIIFCITVLSFIIRDNQYVIIFQEVVVTAFVTTIAFDSARALTNNKDSQIKSD